MHADAGEIAKKARPGTPALPADVLAKYQGKPVILATAVINAAFTDLATFIPPPMTPEEAVLDKAMKGVGPANGALRKGVDASNAELVKTNTAILAKAFADTETFWKGRGNAEAVKIAQTARPAVAAIESAAGMGNWNEAKAQNTTLGQQCAGCHVFRERGEDGSFFVKKDSVARNERQNSAREQRPMKKTVLIFGAVMAFTQALASAQPAQPATGGQPQGQQRERPAPDPRDMGGGRCADNPYNCADTPNPLPAATTVWIEEMTWMDVRDALKAGKTTVIIPTGGIEPNGPWLVTGKHNYVQPRQLRRHRAQAGQRAVRAEHRIRA